MKNFFKSGLILIAILPVQAWCDNGHQAAPMMAPAKSPLTQEEFNSREEVSGRVGSQETILARFRSQFGAEKTRFAIFWNDQLPERVSDWGSRKRIVLGASGELKGMREGVNDDFHAKSSISAQAETRSAQAYSGAELAFALQTGIVNTFRKANTVVIDKSLAMRITDNALEDGTFSRLSPDQARLQMRALDKHADYVVEIIVDNSFSKKPHYQVKVFSISDAAIVASLTTPGTPHDDQHKQSWVVSDNGYEKREQPVSISEIGREIALHTMEVMVENGVTP